MAQAKEPQDLRVDADAAGMPAAAEAVGAGVQSVVDAAQDGAGRLLDAALEVADRTPSPMLKLVIDRAAPAMEDLVRVESELAAFWLEATRAHAQRTIASLQRLAAARDLSAALAIQGDYVRESLTSLQAAFARQMELNGQLLHRMLDQAEAPREAA